MEDFRLDKFCGIRYSTLLEHLSINESEAAMPHAAEFAHLTVAEKLQLVTQLWNQIASSDKPNILPDQVIAEA